MRDDVPASSFFEGLPIRVDDPNNTWATLRIARSIPLSRLEWLWKSRGGSLRDSSSNARAVFDISQEPISSSSTQWSDPCDWFRNPYAYILVTSIEEFDSSREGAWSRIRAFVEKCKEESWEYLVVLAATDEKIALQKRLVERIRAEANTTMRNRERVVTVAPAVALEEQRPITHLHHSPAHQTLLIRLRECVREGAEARIQAYEDEVSRSFINRSAATWSFTSFFVLKEGMAFLFVQLGRRDLAIRLYDELQAIMNSVLDRGELHFKKFCEGDAAAAASGVTNPEIRSYRNLLSQNAITELDMRTYLFARQISFLLLERRFAEVAERGLKFITALARRCAEEALDANKQVSVVFRDIWVFCASTALAAALAPAIPSPHEADKDLSVQLGTPRERHTARLIAGFHVHALKAFVGLANVTLPGCLASADVGDAIDKSPGAATEAVQTTNEKLKHALQDAKSAEAMHAKLTNAAASLYEMGGRARGASALDGDAGVIRLRNRSYKEAETLLSAQCLRFANDNGWDDLHKRQRMYLAQAEKELDRVQEYLVSCLTMLYMSRPARRFWREQLASNDDIDAHAKGALHWASETRTAASRLSRVMKYKADRLFDISVLPNRVPWLEGDPVMAVVRIKSDIPADIEVDKITLECRNSNTSLNTMHKSTLHRYSQSVSTVTSADGDGASTPTSDSGSPTSPTRRPFAAVVAPGSGIVTLQSESQIVLSEGVNKVPVYAGEVHQSGLYKISIVSLFIGNLKLVQPAKKASTVPTVTIKGSSNAKGSALAGSPAVPADFVKGDVKFPMFMVSQREPSAILTVEDQDDLYLVPNSLQLVRLKIVAGKYGVRKGATLTCALLSSSRGRAFTPEIFALPTTTALQINSPPESNILWLKPSSTDNEDTSLGEAIIPHEIQKGETYEARIPICLSETSLASIEGSSSENRTKRSCVIRLHLSGSEEECSTERVFSCFTEQRLSFNMPIEISARVHVRSDWGSTRLHESNDFSAMSYGDGGTLICGLRRITKKEHPVVLMKVALETPAWLDLLSGKDPPHAELLPFALGPNTLFTCAFDMLAHEDTSDQNQLVINRDGESKSDLSRNLLEPNLPRAAVPRVNIAESQDDISIWDPGPLTPKQPEDLRSRLMGVNTFAKQEMTQGDDSNEHDVEGALEVEHLENEPPEEEEEFQVKDAEDVVDLSAGEDEVTKPITAQLASPPANSTSLATLTIEMRIEGLEVPIDTVVSQKVCMNSLQRTVPRYRIERSAQKTGEIGMLMDLQFVVQATNGIRDSRHSPSDNYNDNAEPVELQYEINADPTAWVVVGRRRGKVALKRGQLCTGSATLVPIIPGRHRVPGIRLFTLDGRGLPPSQYENVNSCMQIVILPCRMVISACSHGWKRNFYHTNKQGNGKSSIKQKMPEVIASDSFFGI